MSEARSAGASAPGEGGRARVVPVLTAHFTDAFAFASVVHATQTRKGTTIPYVAHLMAVAALVLEHGGDEDMAIAALLHDAPEDQGGYAMLEQIRARFGNRVADIVASCTDTFADPKPDWRPRKEAYIDHLKDADVAACVVAAADKLHNARTILEDSRALGANLWKRFNATPQMLHWYYDGVANVLARRLEGHRAYPMVEELQQIVATVWGERRGS